LTPDSLGAMVRLSERLRLRRPSHSDPPSQTTPVWEPTDPEPAITSRRELSREVPVGELASCEHPVTHLLYERLSQDDIAAARRLMDGSADFPEAYKNTTDPVLDQMLVLHSGIWHGLDAVAEKTGLGAERPPEDVHAMARGPIAAAGGLYEADLVADALLSAGVDIAASGGGLDFGCSSARVVRALAAAYPEGRWLGCDPNTRAIAWAQQHLPGIEFFVSGDAPPLPLEGGSLGLVFAVSIWSHFEPQLGLRWFEEMRRVLAPGGHLVMTTHGLTSVAFYAGNGLRTAEQCEEIADSLYRRGWWYAPEFGAHGDWGVVNPDWGTTFLTPEWVLAELCPAWRIAEFAAGRNAGNQDVYVLQRA
jgi:SAM-dependent methyltransferase